jgi:putative transposase
MAIPLRCSDPVRATAGARTFFVTSSICEKRNLLQSDRSAELFVRVLYDYRAQGKFRLHEFVVMPDHFPLLLTVLTVDCGMTIERAVQFIKGRVCFPLRAASWASSRPFGSEGFRKCGFWMLTHS